MWPRLKLVVNHVNLPVFLLFFFAVGSSCFTLKTQKMNSKSPKTIKFFGVTTDVSSRPMIDKSQFFSKILVTIEMIIILNQKTIWLRKSQQYRSDMIDSWLSMIISFYRYRLYSLSFLKINFYRKFSYDTLGVLQKLSIDRLIFWK